MTTETEDTTKVEATDEVLRSYGLIFAQLLTSQRFRELFNLYFTLQNVVDEETKTITSTVIENPPEVIAEKMKAAMAAQEPLVQVASPATMKKMANKRARRKTL